MAALVKYYLASLPEPLTTLDLYNEIKGARSSVHSMRNILKKLPSVNYMTLEYVTALLLRVSQKSLLNKAGDISLSHSLFLCFVCCEKNSGSYVCWDVHLIILSLRTLESLVGNVSELYSIFIMKAC